MPRRLPPLANVFASDANNATRLASGIEIVHSAVPRGSIARKQLPQKRIEAIYEMAYLRIFLAWETFLEEAFLRYLCGYASTLGPERLLQPAFPSRQAAELSVLHGLKFVSWARPNGIIDRAQNYVVDGLHETVVSSATRYLDYLADVRNRVAHSSDYARSQFDTAALFLSGSAYRGSSAGRFLRDWDTTARPQIRWLHAIATSLQGLANQIAP